MNAEDRLALANLYVAEGEGRCVRQAALIKELANMDEDTAEAEALLVVMETKLTLTRHHRERLVWEGQANG